MRYKYETHMHTSAASACGVHSGQEMVQYYHRLGYAGVVVTDHFFNGNTCIPSTLPWDKRIHAFCKGYRDAKAEGEKLGLSVFLGLEFNNQGTEFLIYGLTEEWLMEHPEIMKLSIEDALAFFRENGAYIIHCHPFRRAFYIPKVRVFPNLVDAVEVWNMGNSDVRFNHDAMRYAEKEKLPKTAGGDCHWVEGKTSGIVVPEKARDIRHLCEMIPQCELFLDT